MAPILGYWKMRGIVEPVRYILRHLGIEFEDRRLQQDSDTWKEQKFNLGLDFPNLPYYIDGDIKITQCLAICRHLGRTHGLYGETETELLRQGLVEQVADDYRWAMIRLILNPNFESLKDAYIKTLPDQFKQMEKYIGQGPWVAGEKLTYVDFILFETLDLHLYLNLSCLDGLENLKAFHRRILELPNIKTYVNSDKFERWPLFGKQSHFANASSTPLLAPVV